jgi:glycosyltransferase involved in cell wall biosynthesis
VFFASTQLRDEVTEKFPAVSVRSVVIPPPPLLNIIPDPAGSVRRSARVQLGFREEQILLAYFGYIYPGKGVSSLIKAVDLLRHDSPRVHLMLIGGVPMFLEARYAYFARMKDLVDRLGLKDRVTWTGGYDAMSDSASRYLRAADLGVLPYDQGICLHNSSFAALIAHGLPVVTTRGARLDPALIDRANVVLCRSQDPEQLAAKIRELLCDAGLRSRLSSGALRLAHEQFSWDRAIDKYLAKGMTS